MNPRAANGFSIIAAMVGIVVVALGAVLLSRLFSDFRTSEGRLDRRGQVEQTLINAAASFQSSSFSSLVQMCTAAQAYAGPTQGLCTHNGALNTGASVTQNLNNPRLTDVLMNWNGDPDPVRGTICIELTQCQTRASGMGLDITLTEFWLDPDPKVGLTRRPFVFRRTKW